MKIIDSHCHPQFPQYDIDRDEIIRRAFDAGVGMICVGTDLETSKKAIELSEHHGHVWASVGLHPNDNLDEVYEQTDYEKLATHPKVVAIGEIGLDYYRTTDPTKKEFQKKRFLEQLSLAEKLNKPVIIHCRDGSTSSAHEDMLAILGEKNLRGVIHSFTSTRAHAEAYCKLGFMIGFNGIITFTDQYNDALRAVPLESILLETDAPYLAPIPFRGKRNEPSYILEVIRQIGILRDIPDEDVIAVTSETARSLFGLKSYQVGKF